MGDEKSDTVAVSFLIGNAGLNLIYSGIDENIIQGRRSNMKQFLCFKIRGYWFGIDVENVIEIVNPTSLNNTDSPVFPGDDSFVYHGAVLPNVHLEDILFGEQVKYDTSKRILVSEISDLKAGIIVDSAEEILSVGDEQIRQLTPGLVPFNNEYLNGYIPSEERNIYLISSDKIGELVSAK